MAALYHPAPHTELEYNGSKIKFTLAPVARTTKGPLGPLPGPPPSPSSPNS